MFVFYVEIRILKKKKKPAFRDSIHVMTDSVKKKGWNFYNNGANLKQGTVPLEIEEVLSLFHTIISLKVKIH